MWKSRPKKPFHVKKIKQMIEPVNQQGLPVRGFHLDRPVFPAPQVPPVRQGGHQGPGGIYKELRQAVPPDAPGQVGGMGQLPVLGDRVGRPPPVS